MKTKVYANDKVIIFKPSNKNLYLIYKTMQYIEMESLDKYEEITNEIVNKTLIESHNECIMNFILNESKKPESDQSNKLISAAYDALIDYKDRKRILE